MSQKIPETVAKKVMQRSASVGKVANAVPKNAVTSFAFRSLPSVLKVLKKSTSLLDPLTNTRESLRERYIFGHLQKRKILSPELLRILVRDPTTQIKEILMVDNKVAYFRMMHSQENGDFERFYSMDVPNMKYLEDVLKADLKAEEDEATSNTSSIIMSSAGKRRGAKKAEQPDHQAKEKAFPLVGFRHSEYAQDLPPTSNLFPHVPKPSLIKGLINASVTAVGSVVGRNLMAPFKSWASKNNTSNNVVNDQKVGGSTAGATTANVVDTPSATATASETIAAETVTKDGQKVALRPVELKMGGVLKEDTSSSIGKEQSSISSSVPPVNPISTTNPVGTPNANSNMPLVVLANGASGSLLSKTRQPCLQNLRIGGFGNGMGGGGYNYASGGHFSFFFRSVISGVAWICGILLAFRAVGSIQNSSLYQALNSGKKQEKEMMKESRKNRKKWLADYKPGESIKNPIDVDRFNGDFSRLNYWAAERLLFKGELDRYSFTKLKEMVGGTNKTVYLETSNANLQKADANPGSENLLDSTPKVLRTLDHQRTAGVDVLRLDITLTSPKKEKTLNSKKRKGSDTFSATETGLTPRTPSKDKFSVSFSTALVPQEISHFKCPKGHHMIPRTRVKDLLKEELESLEIHKTATDGGTSTALVNTDEEKNPTDRGSKSDRDSKSSSISSSMNSDSSPVSPSWTESSWKTKLLAKNSSFFSESGPSRVQCDLCGKQSDIIQRQTCHCPTCDFDVCAGCVKLLRKLELRLVMGSNNYVGVQAVDRLIDNELNWSEKGNIGHGGNAMDKAGDGGMKMIGDASSPNDAIAVAIQTAIAKADEGKDTEAADENEEDGESSKGDDARGLQDNGQDEEGIAVQVGFPPVKKSVKEKAQTINPLPNAFTGVIPAHPIEPSDPAALKLLQVPTNARLERRQSFGGDSGVFMNDNDSSIMTDDPNASSIDVTTVDTEIIENPAIDDPLAGPSSGPSSSSTPDSNSDKINHILDDSDDDSDEDNDSWGLFGGLVKISNDMKDPRSENELKLKAEENVETRFKDVIGQQIAVSKIREFCDILRSPSEYAMIGSKVPKGGLLIGPPGTGKTLLARAVAGECGLPFLSIQGSDIGGIIVGLGARNVKALFEKAREHAHQHGGCIVFIDEIDSIGGHRSSGGSRGNADTDQSQTLNQLLVEMDGFASGKDAPNVVVLAATNRVSVLDQALLRAGRFDRIIPMEQPSVKERQELFDYYLRRMAWKKDCLGEENGKGMLGKMLSNVEHTTPGTGDMILKNEVHDSTSSSSSSSSSRQSLSSGCRSGCCSNSNRGLPSIREDRVVVETQQTPSFGSRLSHFMGLGSLVGSSNAEVDEDSGIDSIKSSPSANSTGTNPNPALKKESNIEIGTQVYFNPPKMEPRNASAPHEKSLEKLSQVYSEKFEGLMGTVVSRKYELQVTESYAILDMKNKEQNKSSVNDHTGKGTATPSGGSYFVLKEGTSEELFESIENIVEGAAVVGGAVGGGAGHVGSGGFTGVQGLRMAGTNIVTVQGENGQQEICQPQSPAMSNRKMRRRKSYEQPVKSMTLKIELEKFPENAVDLAETIMNDCVSTAAEAMGSGSQSPKSSKKSNQELVKQELLHSAVAQTGSVIKTPGGGGMIGVADIPKTAPGTGTSSSSSSGENKAGSQSPRKQVLKVENVIENFYPLRNDQAMIPSEGRAPVVVADSSMNQSQNIINQEVEKIEKIQQETVLLPTNNNIPIPRTGLTLKERVVVKVGPKYYITDAENCELIDKENDPLFAIASRAARLTSGFTGASIASVCNEAGILAVREQMNSSFLDLDYVKGGTGKSIDKEIGQTTIYSNSNYNSSSSSSNSDSSESSSGCSESSSGLKNILKNSNSTSELKNNKNNSSNSGSNSGRRSVTGRGLTSLSEHHIAEAIEFIIAGSEKPTLKITKEEKAATAFHESGHTTVAYFLNKQNGRYPSPVKVTIMPRDSGSLGYMMPGEALSEVSKTRQELLDSICVAMGGRVAEEIFLGHEAVATGASSDIDKATELAQVYVHRYGLAGTYNKFLNTSEEAAHQHGYRWSEKTREQLDKQIFDIIDQSYKRTHQILEEHREVLTNLKERLMDKETIYQKEIEEIMEGKN